MNRALATGERWMLFPSAAFVPLVAIAYPAVVVERFLAFTNPDVWPSARRVPPADDSVVCHFARRSRLEVWATVPCLVDHRDDVPSLVKATHRPGPHRRAAAFVDG